MESARRGLRLRASRVADLPFRGLALLAAGSSIAALLLHAAGWVAMPYSIGFITLPGLVLLLVLVAWSGRADHRPLHNRLVVGTVGGLLATAAYDMIRWAVVEAAAIDFDPFGPILAFGQFITGDPPTTLAAAAAGWAYHISNGWTFGIAYAVIAGAARWWWGVAWAMVLEVAMVLVYPVLFGIRYVEPFVVVSVVGHVAYGTVLGVWCQRNARARWS